MVERTKSRDVPAQPHHHASRCSLPCTHPHRRLFLRCARSLGSWTAQGGTNPGRSLVVISHQCLRQDQGASCRDGTGPRSHAARPSMPSGPGPSLERVQSASGCNNHLVPCVPPEGRTLDTRHDQNSHARPPHLDVHCQQAAIPDNDLPVNDRGGHAARGAEQQRCQGLVKAA